MKKTIVYSAFLTAALAAFLSPALGTAVHAAIALGVTAAVAQHLLKQRAWMRSVRRRRGAHPEARLAVFNIAFAVVFAVCLSTGVVLLTGAAPAWLAGVHGLSAFSFTLMIFGHVFMNRRRIRAWSGSRRRRQRLAVATR